MRSRRGVGGDAGLLIGRVMMAALYLPFGLLKAENFGHTVGFMRMLHAPIPPLAAGIAVLCETIFPLLIIIGFQTRLLCVIMMIYTAGATYLAHRFWLLPPDQAMEAQINFFKNIAIIGGFLILAVSGPGALSVDKE